MLEDLQILNNNRSKPLKAAFFENIAKKSIFSLRETLTNPCIVNKNLVGDSIDHVSS
jgi:hypothetical protein